MQNKYRFQVQGKKRIRVILDTDAACEADDQYAIVHTVLTPRFDIRGIIAEQFFNSGGADSVNQSYDEVKKILKLLDANDIPVFHGAALPLQSECDQTISEGARLIIREALKADEKPLFVLCQGAITNVSAALIHAPEIANRFTCIWIGGGFYPEGGWEFNLLNDYHAANVAFRTCQDLWQVPMDGYTRMQVSYAELQVKVMPYGEIGQYLFDEMQAVGMKEDWINGESWSLGDSPAIGLALSPGCGHYELRKAPIVNEKGSYVGETQNSIRVYHEIDSRFILEDFFAKLRISLMP